MSAQSRVGTHAWNTSVRLYWEEAGGAMLAQVLRNVHTRAGVRTEGEETSPVVLRLILLD